MQHQPPSQSIGLLLLSASYGAGHVRAAEACIKHATQAGITATHIDLLSVLPTMLAHLLRYPYLSITRTFPRIYGWLYYASRNQQICHVYQSLYHPILRLYAKHYLAPRIEQHHPTHIICTHFFASEAIEVLIKAGVSVPPYYVCITDYSYHPMWFAAHAAGYLVGASIVADQMIQQGISADCIHTTGIPVDPIFSKKTTHARDSITILLGGYGLVAPIADITRTIQQYPHTPINIVCGKNKRLFKRLTHQLQHNTHVTVHGWVDIPPYIQQSTRVITKPGGLTVTECLVARTPIEVISPIPGQEMMNATFLQHTPKEILDSLPVFSAQTVVDVIAPESV